MKYLIILLIAPLVWSCSSDEPGPERQEATPFTFVEAQQKLTWSKGDLRGFVDIGGFDFDEEKIKYDASIYRVVYNTDYKGDSIPVSAIVILPETESVEAVSTISFQHGTIASDAEAPTNLSLTNSQLILLSILSSSGMVVVVPDYIGFGESVEIMHPYYVEDLTATTVVNSIYASRQLAGEKEIELNTDLFLAGYSQGGYATMAAHKYYEEQGMPYYDLRASFPAAGGYDVKAFQEYFFALETYHEPFFLAYVANAYKVSYDWEEPLSLLFKEPYATEIPGYFDGSMNGTAINAKLTTTLADLLQEDVVTGIETETYDFLTNAFRENSLTDWVPTIRMFMYHGDVDVTVPYQNSVDVYNQFISNGASENIVTFTTIEGGAHVSGAGSWAFSLLEELEKLGSE
ncbi:MAG: lipase family protein [Marinoscillum sp.]